MESCIITSRGTEKFEHKYNREFKEMMFHYTYINARGTGFKCITDDLELARELKDVWLHRRDCPARNDRSFKSDPALSADIRRKCRGGDFWGNRDGLD
jgi:hypothetical protein